MKKIKRVGVRVGLLLGGGGMLLATWFYISIPSPPEPPPHFPAQVDTASSVDWPEVRTEVRRMEWVDQKIRQEFAQSLRAEEIEGVSGLLAAMRYSFLEARVDERHTTRLKELVNEYGWPHKGRVGEKGAEAAFLIAQHADHDLPFQRAVLDSVREAYQNGDASGQQVALLMDRIRVADGRPQRYGTQAQLQHGTLRVHAIEDSVAVDQRRSELGLPPLKEYIEKMREEYQR